MRRSRQALQRQDQGPSNGAFDEMGHLLVAGSDIIAPSAEERDSKRSESLIISPAAKSAETGHKLRFCSRISAYQSLIFQLEQTRGRLARIAPGRRMGPSDTLPDGFTKTEFVPTFRENLRWALDETVKVR